MQDVSTINIIIIYFGQRAIVDALLYNGSCDNNAIYSNAIVVKVIMQHCIKL